MSFVIFFFFFNDTATTEIYTLSLHDALPISSRLATRSVGQEAHTRSNLAARCAAATASDMTPASQSRAYRALLAATRRLAQYRRARSALQTCRGLRGRGRRGKKCERGNC